MIENPPPPPQAPLPPPASSGLAPNIASLLCYLCSIVTGVIFLLIEKTDKEVRFHAWQSIFLGLAWIAFAILINLLVLILGSLVGFLGVIISFLGGVGYLAFLVVTVIAMVKAYQGEHWVIPYIGNFAEQQIQKSA